MSQERVHLPRVPNAGKHVRAGFYPPRGEPFTVCGLKWPPAGWPFGSGWVSSVDEWNGSDEAKCPDCWGRPGERALPTPRAKSTH